MKKLIGCKQIQPSYADGAKEEFIYLQRSVVRENKGYFSDNVKSGRLDEFCMRYLKGSIHHKTLTSIIQLVLVLSHVQAALKPGFSLGDKLLVEKMKSESLIAPRFVKDFIIANNYHTMFLLLKNSWAMLNHQTNAINPF